MPRFPTVFWEEEEGEEGIQLVELRREGPGNMEEDWPSHITGRHTTTRPGGGGGCTRPVTQPCRAG